jgi:hypothetical protein
MVRDQTLQTKNFQIKFPGNNVSNQKKSTQQDEYTTTMRGSSQPYIKMNVPPRTDASDGGETELMRKTTVIGFGSRDTSQGKLMSKTAQSWAPKRKNMKILKNIIRQNAGGADGGSGDEAAEQNSNTMLYEHRGRYSYKDCEIPDDLVTVWAKNTPNTFMNKFIECGDREFFTKASVKGKSRNTGHPRVQKSPGTYISLGDRKYLTSMNKTRSMLNASMQDFTRLGLLMPDAVKPQANNAVSKPEQGNHYHHYHKVISGLHRKNQSCQNLHVGLNFPNGVSEGEISNPFNMFFKGQGESESFVRGLYENFKGAILRTKYCVEDYGEF